jgi:RNA polymerase sigma-70 factor (ECF subfamily)
MVDSSKVESWVEAYGREIHAYLWRILGDSQDAEDGLQETFLRALRTPEKTPIRQPRPWLYAVAGNVARSQLRKRQRQTAREADLDEETLTVEDAAAPARERAEAVRRVVNRLPAKQREALLLRRYQGLDYEAIGEALGCSPQAARANVYQAMRKLRSLFAEEDR